MGDLLGGKGIVVPERTLHRYCAERCRDSSGRRTVRLADPDPDPDPEPDPGQEPQTDFAGWA
jgi:hypothetical protein